MSLDELMLLTAIPPDRTVEKGTPRSRRNPDNVHPHSGVSFESRLDRSTDIQAHLDDLLERLGPARDAFRTFVEKTRMEDPDAVPVRIWLYLESSEQMVGFDVTDEQLRAVSEFGAHLAVEFDFDDEPEDE
jgi:Domain of unknown function (DUF4279)